MKKIILPIFILISIFFIYFQINQDIEILEEKQIVYKTEIKGEINNPGIYEIEKNETLEQLIEKAGGVTEKADLRNLSLQQIILHKEVIVIPKKSEKIKVSINSATLDQLITLPGIGSSKANLIIEYRKTKSFKSIEDIMNVKGIGEKIFNKIKDLICL